MTATLDALKRRFGAEQLLQLADSEGLGHSWTRCECPGCRNGDARGASIGEVDGVGLWHCKRDDQHRGTAIDLVMLARDLSLPDAVAALEKVAAGVDSGAATGRADGVSVRFVPRAYPPAGEVAQLWASARPLSDVIDVAAEWRERGLDVATIEERDLARALPYAMSLPKWARAPILHTPKPWSEYAYRLIVPMFDARGLLVSIHARSTDADPKGVHPRGHKAGGLVMADATARQLLLGERTEPCDVLVAEGVPDFFAWGTRWGDAAERAPAVFSVLAGSWTAEIAARIPDGSRVCVATHEDPTGDKYAEQIRATLARGCEVLRFSYGACLSSAPIRLQEAA